MANCQSLVASTVNVRFQEPFNAAGQNDIDKMRSYCTSALPPESIAGMTDATVKYAKQIGFNQLRGLNIDNTHANSASDQNYIDRSGSFIAGSRFKTFLKTAQQYRYTPYIVVGQQPPHALIKKYGPAWRWSASTWDLYRDYALKFVRYAAVDYEGSGFNAIQFEVGNEIDVTNPNEIWTQEIPGDAGSPARYAHLKKIYEIWQAAVRQVAKEAAGSRKIWITGPAITPHVMEFGLALHGLNWQDRFIDDVAHNQWQLDQFTFHFYGDQGSVGNGQPHPFFKSIKDRITPIQAKLKSRGLNIGVGITEWGSSSSTDGSMLGRLNYRHESAAWAIAFVNDVASVGVDSAVHLLLRDDFGASKTGTATFPSYIYSGEYEAFPKPVFNACRMIRMLPGSRVKTMLPPQQPNLVAIASANSNSASIILANYKLAFDTPVAKFIDQSTPEKVRITLSGLPFSGNAILKRYLIDANTSNVAQYLDNRMIPVLSGSELQQVDHFAVTVANGSVTLPEVTLAQSTVSQWVISPNR